MDDDAPPNCNDDGSIMRRTARAHTMCSAHQEQKHNSPMSPRSVGRPVTGGVFDLMRTKLINWSFKLITRVRRSDHIGLRMSSVVIAKVYKYQGW